MVARALALVVVVLAVGLGVLSGCRVTPARRCPPAAHCDGCPPTWGITVGRAW